MAFIFEQPFSVGGDGYGSRLLRGTEVSVRVKINKLFGIQTDDDEIPIANFHLNFNKSSVP